MTINPASSSIIFMNDKDKNENTEVDLRDYLKLIFAKKWLVLGVLLFVMVMAAVYNIQVPKIYEVSAWLEIGRIKESALIESSARINQKMKIGIYGSYPYNISIFNPDQTDFIQIKIESDKPDGAKKELETISNLILAEHEDKIKLKKEELEKEIKNLETRNNLLKQIGTLEAKIEMEDVNLGIASLKNLLGNIQYTKILKITAISDKSANSKSFLIFVIAGLAGLFFGVFLVFWKKWWEGFKN